MSPTVKRILLIAIVVALFSMSSCGVAEPDASQTIEVTTSLKPSSSRTIMPSPSPSPSPLTLEQQKEKIESKYEIVVQFGTNAIQVPGCEYDPIYDEELIYKGLVLLDEQLALYPEGFFTQLRIDKDKPFRFIFTSGTKLFFTDGLNEGVTTEYDGMHIILLNISEQNWQSEWGVPFLPIKKYA